MNYRKNYFKIYLWQTISVLLGFAALFVVVPYISSNRTIYGIYSVCTSLTIFFSYADLGFLSSGVKYAAEYYIKGQHDEELRIIGFTSFIMLIVFSVLAIGLLFLGFFPKILIPELIESSEQMYIARWLLFTLALFCPIIIGQRLLNLIYTIRVEDYKFQRFNIIGNIVRILSVFIFFGKDRYMLVEYYIFYQIVNLGVVVVALLYARKHYGYSLESLLLSIRFDKEIFDKVKHLAGTALIMTISSIAYLELDQVAISNYLGLKAVAMYAVALSVFQLVRSFCSIVYSPYTSRYNHFVGLSDYSGLIHFVKKMIMVFAPIIIVPILTLSFMAEPFVVSWVGNQYSESGALVSFLVLSFIFNFVKEPIGSYFLAIERNELLIMNNIIIPLVYWGGIITMIGIINTKAFAIMKFVAPAINVSAYWFLASKNFKANGYRFLSLAQLMKMVIPTVMIVSFFSWVFTPFLIEDYSKWALFVNLFIIALVVIFSLIATVPFNSELRLEINHYYNSFIAKRK